MDTDTLTRVRAEAEAAGHQLLRAVPRGPHHLLVAMTGPDGAEAVGQWFDDPGRCARTAAETEAVADTGVVRRLGPHLLLQAGGADRRLLGLERLVRREDATLVAHRPERRAVVVHEHGALRCYTKVVRPDRLPALVDTLRAVAGSTSVRVPAVIAADAARGCVTVTEVEGHRLHEALGDACVGDTALAAACEAVGRTLRRLHQTGLGAGLGAGRRTHDAAAELMVTRDWLGQAGAHGLLADPDLPIASLLDTACRLLDGPPSGTGLLHRDLHDKQLLITAEDVGVLDLDLAVHGDPALDLANLLVHLELRAHQGLLTPRRARLCADAVVAGYGPFADPIDGPIADPIAERLRGYGWATRLRLLGVYAFRPHSTRAALRLITDPLLQETT